MSTTTPTLSQTQTTRSETNLNIRNVVKASHPYSMIGKEFPTNRNPKYERSSGPVLQSSLNNRREQQKLLTGVSSSGTISSQRRLRSIGNSPRRATINSAERKNHFISRLSLTSNSESMIRPASVSAGFGSRKASLTGSIKNIPSFSIITPTQPPPSMYPSKSRDSLLPQPKLLIPSAKGLGDSVKCLPNDFGMLPITKWKMSRGAPNFNLAMQTRNPSCDFLKDIGKIQWKPFRKPDIAPSVTPIVPLKVKPLGHLGHTAARA